MCTSNLYCPVRTETKSAASMMQGAEDGVDTGPDQLRRQGGKLFSTHGVSATIHDEVLAFAEAEPA